MKNTKELMNEILQGNYDKELKEVYVDESVLEYQRKRYANAISEYAEVFGDEGSVEIYSAPGRCEVGGNHTDHQHGMVLATSINQDALAVAGLSEDGQIHVLSDGYDMVYIDADDLDVHYEEEGTTAALVRGMASELRARGYEVKGFNAYIVSDVLIGAGLSSSGSFEVLLGTIISGLFNDGEIEPHVIAQAGQYAENVFFGKPCGLMDQTACATGGMIHIDFKDPMNPAVEKVPFDLEAHGYSLCVVDTKASHSDLTDEYSTIPADMKKVSKFYGKEYLRDVDETEFYKQISGLRGVMGDRTVLRALHFFEEEKRVEGMVQALCDDNFPEFLELVKESGDSSFKYLQNIYSIHDVERQGMSIALAVSDKILRKHGVSRVHGGGFAGTILIFVENDFVEEYKTRMNRVFGKGSCQVLKVRQQGGMKVV